MGRRLEFARSESEGLFTYRYVSEQSPFERHWPGLYESYEAGRNPWSEWAVNNNNTEEVALYLGLIWRLTEGRRRFVVPRYHREAGMHAAGEPYALIDWEYEVEDIDRGEPGRPAGFLPARSSIQIMPAPGPWQRENRGKAGLFEIAAFTQLKHVVRGLLGDATAELNLYAVERTVYPPLPETFDELLQMEPEVDERSDALAAALTGGRTPGIAEVLRAGEVFADLTIGVDSGYADLIVMHALHDISRALDALLDEYEAAVDAYEADVDGLARFDEFDSRLRRLVGVDAGEWAD